MGRKEERKVDREVGEQVYNLFIKTGDTSTPPYVSTTSEMSRFLIY